MTVAAVAMAVQAVHADLSAFTNDPALHVATTSFVADVQVTVAALAMATQVVQALLLSQVPAAQAAVHVVMVPATAVAPLPEASVPAVDFNVAVAHTSVAALPKRESVAEVHVILAAVAAPAMGEQAVQAVKILKPDDLTNLSLKNPVLQVSTFVPVTVSAF